MKNNFKKLNKFSAHCFHIEDMYCDHFIITDSGQFRKHGIIFVLSLIKISLFSKKLLSREYKDQYTKNFVFTWKPTYMYLTAFADDYFLANSIDVMDYNLR
jgi:hypothetical protein